MECGFLGENLPSWGRSLAPYATPLELIKGAPPSSAAGPHGRSSVPGCDGGRVPAARSDLAAGEVLVPRLAIGWVHFDKADCSFATRALMRSRSLRP